MDRAKALAAAQALVEALSGDEAPESTEEETVVVSGDENTVLVEEAPEEQVDTTIVVAPEITVVVNDDDSSETDLSTDVVGEDATVTEEEVEAPDVIVESEPEVVTESEVEPDTAPRNSHWSERKLFRK